MTIDIQLIEYLLFRFAGGNFKVDIKSTLNLTIIYLSNSFQKFEDNEPFFQFQINWNEFCIGTDILFKASFISLYYKITNYQKSAIISVK
jgi:hypothetical protein